MRWVVLRQPLRRNGGWRCGVDVVAARSVAQASAQARKLLRYIVVGVGRWRRLRLPPAVPSFRRGAQATLRVHRLDIVRASAMHGVVAIVMLLAIPVGAAEPRVDLQPLGAADCVLSG